MCANAFCSNFLECVQMLLLDVDDEPEDLKFYYMDIEISFIESTIRRLLQDILHGTSRTDLKTEAGHLDHGTSSSSTRTTRSSLWTPIPRIRSPNLGTPISPKTMCDISRAPIL